MHELKSVEGMKAKSQQLSRHGERARCQSAGVPFVRRWSRTVIWDAFRELRPGAAFDIGFISGMCLVRRGGGGLGRFNLHDRLSGFSHGHVDAGSVAVARDLADEILHIVAMDFFGHWPNNFPGKPEEAGFDGMRQGMNFRDLVRLDARLERGTYPARSCPLGDVHI